MSLDTLVFGEASGAQGAEFDIQNRRLKELCRQADQLSAEDQNVLCHLMESLIRKDQMKAVLDKRLPKRR